MRLTYTHSERACGRQEDPKLCDFTANQESFGDSLAVVHAARRPGRECAHSRGAEPLRHCRCFRVWPCRPWSSPRMRGPDPGLRLARSSSHRRFRHGRRGSSLRRSWLRWAARAMVRRHVRRCASADAADAAGVAVRSWRVASASRCPAWCLRRLRLRRFSKPGCTCGSVAGGAVLSSKDDLLPGLGADSRPRQGIRGGAAVPGEVGR